VDHNLKQKKMILGKIGSKIAQNSIKSLNLTNQLPLASKYNLTASLNVNLSMLHTYSVMNNQLFRTFAYSAHSTQKYFFMKDKSEMHKGMHLYIVDFIIFVRVKIFNNL
jgi:hypothetical protein